MQTRSLKSLNILVAEDDGVNQTLLKAIFKRIGCEYTIVDTGTKILESLQGPSPYDLILMDIEMPDMDGYEATSKIRKELAPPVSNIPIISTTAHINDAHLKKCLAVGMNEFVFKPIKMEDLISKIKLVLGNVDDDGALEAKTATPPAEKKGLFNFQALTTACGGNVTIAKNIVKMFISQTPENMTQLKAFLGKADWTAFKNLCHKAKSSYALLGFEQVKKILEEMENDCAQHNYNVSKFEANLSLVDMINGNIIQTLEETLKNEK